MHYRGASSSKSYSPIVSIMSKPCAALTCQNVLCENGTPQINSWHCLSLKTFYWQHININICMISYLEYLIWAGRLTWRWGSAIWAPWLQHKTPPFRTTNQQTGSFYPPMEHCSLWLLKCIFTPRFSAMFVGTKPGVFRQPITSVWVCVYVCVCVQCFVTEKIKKIMLKIIILKLFSISNLRFFKF